MKPKASARKDAETAARDRIKKHVKKDGLVTLIFLEHARIGDEGLFRGDIAAFTPEHALEYVLLGQAVPAGELTEEDLRVLVRPNARARQFQNRPLKLFKKSTASPFVGVKEIAALLCVSKWTVLEWTRSVSEDAIPCYGRKPLLFKPAEVLAWFERTRARKGAVRMR